MCIYGVCTAVQRLLNQVPINNIITITSHACMSASAESDRVTMGKLMQRLSVQKLIDMKICVEQTRKKN